MIPTSVSRPLVILSALCAGILLAHAGVSLYAAFILLGVALAVLLTLAGIRQTSRHNFLTLQRIAPWHWLWVVMMSCATGIFTASLHRPDHPEVSPPKNAIITGEILHTSSGNLTVSTRLAVSSIADSAGSDITKHHNFLLLIRSRTNIGAPGDIIRFRANLTPLTPDPNKFEDSYFQYLQSQGIHYIHTDPSYLIDQELPSDAIIVGRSMWPSAIFERARSLIITRLEYSSLRKDVRDFIIAILLGYTQHLDSDTRRSFSMVGLSHMLAVSGLHIGIISSIIFALLLPINLLGGYRYRYPLAIIVIWLYVILCGLSPSTVRAAIMVTFVCIGLLLQRPHSAAASLLWAAFFILVFSPSALFDIGFQLSFVCVASLMAFASPLNTIGHKQHPILYRISEGMLVTLIATIGAWPLTSTFFAQIPLLFLPSNLLILPLLPLYMIAALSFTILAVMGISPSFLAKVLELGYDGMIALVNIFAAEGAVVNMRVHWWVAVIWCIGLAMAALMLHSPGPYTPPQRHTKRRHAAHPTSWATYHPRSYRAGWCIASLCLASAIITAVAFPTPTPPDSFIIRRSHSDISLLLRLQGRDTTLTFPPHRTSQITLPIAPNPKSSYPPSSVIIAIDSDSLPPTPLPVGKYILGGHSHIPISLLKNRIPSGALLLLHPSIHHRRLPSILHDADSLQIPYHNLRISPYHYQATP